MLYTSICSLEAQLTRNKQIGYISLVNMPMSLKHCCGTRRSSLTIVGSGTLLSSFELRHGRVLKLRQVIAQKITYRLMYRLGILHKPNSSKVGRQELELGRFGIFFWPVLLPSCAKRENSFGAGILTSQSTPLPNLSLIEEHFFPFFSFMSDNRWVGYLQLCNRTPSWAGSQISPGNSLDDYLLNDV